MPACSVEVGEEEIVDMISRKGISTAGESAGVKLYK
jgi:hypothetical protein